MTGLRNSKNTRERNTTNAMRTKRNTNQSSQIDTAHTDFAMLTIKQSKKNKKKVELSLVVPFFLLSL